METHFDSMKINDLLDGVDFGRVELAKKRQVAVWAHKRPDSWPILLNEALSDAQEATLPNPNYKEAFYDSDLMLAGQMRGVFSVLNSNSDNVPSIRANMGTGTMVSCLGKRQEVFTDKMPWLQEHLTKEEISKLEPDDISIDGDFELGITHVKRFMEVLEGRIAVYCMDTQGPFDLAHLILGDQLFYEVYDDPSFVHHLMEIAVQLGIKGHEWVKKLSGEPNDLIYHGNALYAENMGIRICEDTTAIVSPEIMETFAIPYTAKLAAHFSGAWVHYCGRHDGLTEQICALPEIRGINFGHIPGHEHDHIFEEDMELCLKSDKVYFGSWPIRDGESGEDYFRRLHEWAAKGCLIPQGGAAVNCENGFKSNEEALDFWYSL
jgi:hypothetical protein